MIRVLKSGTYLRYMTCINCGCYFNFETKDMTTKYKKDKTTAGGFLCSDTVKCPECGTEFIVQTRKEY